MAAATSLKHTHTWRRIRGTVRDPIYICNHPDCFKQGRPRVLLGKSSLCNKCHQPFKLDSYALKTAAPFCELCRNTKDAEIARRARRIMENDVTFSFIDRKEESDDIGFEEEGIHIASDSE